MKLVIYFSENLRRFSTSIGVSKGHCAVYVGEIQDVLAKVEEEFGFDHLTIPC
uniref:Uncharacterized protein n=1 Tax=Solanum lycopersicum TaxID=4081 RepID=A0A3Q7IHL1_SOLLC